jgi:hypothetical protein
MPQHAKQAVVTAMQMQAALPAVNKAFAAKGWPEVKIGVGVNTGEMTVGDMGSSVRKAYTVMGDAVNLGSRLEGITKQYGVGILVGEGTRKAIKDIVFREVDRVQVKGKEEPVAIYEPIGLESDVGQGGAGRAQAVEPGLALLPRPGMGPGGGDAAQSVAPGTRSGALREVHGESLPPAQGTAGRGLEGRLEIRDQIMRTTR